MMAHRAAEGSARCEGRQPGRRILRGVPGERRR